MEVSKYKWAHIGAHCAYISINARSALGHTVPISPQVLIFTMQLIQLERTTACIVAAIWAMFSENSAKHHIRSVLVRFAYQKDCVTRTGRAAFKLIDFFFDYCYSHFEKCIYVNVHNTEVRAKGTTSTGIVILLNTSILQCTLSLTVAELDPELCRQTMLHLCGKTHK